MTEQIQTDNRIYPPFVRGEEAERRWRLVTYAALALYGFELGDPLTRWDRVLVWQTQRSLYGSEVETGEGELAPEQAQWLCSLGLL